MNDWNIKDEILFLEDNNRDLYIQGKTLFFKNKEFERFLWGKEGIEEPSIKYIVSKKKTAYVISGSYSPDFKDTYDVNESGLVGIKFVNCKFDSFPLISNGGIENISYEDCTFDGGDGCISHSLLNYRQNLRVFIKDCKFTDFNLGDIADIQYHADVELCKFYLYGGAIENLSIENVEVVSKFYINKQSDNQHLTTEIESLTIENSTFKEKFKLHCCDIKKCIIKDSDFDEQADFYKTVFHEGMNYDNDKTIYFKALHFRKLTLFGDCEFKQKVDFKYVTFEDFSHFKRAEFKKGLNLDDANIQKEMNFFDIQGLNQNDGEKVTSRETYRVIKSNFQKIGNQIDANKYHVLELNAKRRDTSITNIQDFFVYWGHFITSNFGSSVWLPLMWIFVVSIIASYFLHKPFCYDYQYLSIFSSIKLDEHPLLFIFHKSSLGYLYYQFINAVRRDVKK